MRTMKDKERLLIIIKVFLDMNGPSSAKEILDYINRCPVKIQKRLTIQGIGNLLKNQRLIKKKKDNGKKTRNHIYWVEQ